MLTHCNRPKVGIKVLKISYGRILFLVYEAIPNIDEHNKTKDKDWDQYIPKLLFAHRTAIYEAMHWLHTTSCYLWPFTSTSYFLWI